MTTGCDYSFARPSITALAPYALIGRYAGGSPKKELSLAEAQELTKAGKRIPANFESTGRGGSYAQGQADAHYADSHFRSCGAEGDFVIFFSIAYDAPEDSQDNYFRGIVSVIGQGRTDAYASRAIILHLRSIHAIRSGQSGWRSMSTGWAGGAGSPSEFSVIQDGPGPDGNVDLDTAYVPLDTFTFVSGTAVPPTPTPGPPPGQTSRYRATHNIYTPVAVDGVFGRHTVRALQYVLGVASDGYFGAISIKALQHLLGVCVDGVVGPQTTRALQQRVGATVDGQWGPHTTNDLQKTLNAGRLY